MYTRPCPRGNHPDDLWSDAAKEEIRVQTHSSSLALYYSIFFGVSLHHLILISLLLIQVLCIHRVYCINSLILQMSVGSFWGDSLLH